MNAEFSSSNRVGKLPPIHRIEPLLAFLNDPNLAPTRIMQTYSKSPNIMVTAVLSQEIVRDLMPEIQFPQLKVVFSPLKKETSPSIEIDGENRILHISNPVDACEAYNIVSDPGFHNDEPVVISTQILGAPAPESMPDSEYSNSIHRFAFNLYNPFDYGRKKETTPPVETAPIADKPLPTDIEDKPHKPHEPPDIVVILHDEGIERFVNLRGLLERS